MEKRALSITYQYINQRAEWNKDQLMLITRAKEAADKAHAVYSNFMVGAAVQTEDGDIYTANNQENAAYPSGLCAERVLLFYLNANFPHKKIKRLVVVAHPKGVAKFKPVSPCGACRQVMVEYRDKFSADAEIIMADVDGTEGYIFNSVLDLLPFTFDGNFLK